MSKLTVGAELDPIEMRSTLTTSVMYAGASGDMNPLHYDQQFAAQVSPTGGIIAHGMYSMGLASRLLTAAAGDPERVREIEVRFTKPWPLGSTARFGGRVTSVEQGEVVVELIGTSETGETILRGRGRLVV
jgi:acyl dehydratase